MAERILIFARAPRPGASKTRLIPALGRRGSARLAARLIEHTVARVSAARLAPVTLCCTPDIHHALFRRLAQRYGLGRTQQRGRDLGARMFGALRRALCTADAAIAIGTDCPTLDATTIHAAQAALRDGHDAVLVPARDGGYALIGLRSPWRALFARVDWGSARVSRQTRARAARLGLRVAVLEAVADLDRPRDLLRAGLRLWERG
jgi:hypothetical protein